MHLISAYRNFALMSVLLTCLIRFMQTCRIFMFELYRCTVLCYCLTAIAVKMVNAVLEMSVNLPFIVHFEAWHQFCLRNI